MTNIHTRPWLTFGFVLAVCLGFATTAPAALTTNRWATGSGFGKWEDGAKWDNGVPGPANAINIISFNIPPGGYTVTIDAATVLSHTMNGCLTISNLTISGSNPNQHALFLNNTLSTPGNIPLTILSNLTVNSGGSVTITNSRLVVGSPTLSYFDYVSLRNNGIMLLNSGDLVSSAGLHYIGDAGSGRMTVQAGTWDARYVAVGNGGLGTLTIAGGTTKVFPYLSLGHEAGRSGNVGTGTVWMTGGELVSTNIGGVQNTVVLGGAGNGGYGVGQMTVSNGTWRAGEVTVNTGGTLTIAGGSTMLGPEPYHALWVGFGTTGTVWMTGGQLNMTDAFTFIGYVCEFCEGRGQMTISNGTWLAKQVVVMFKDQFNTNVVNGSNSGTLTLAGGTSVISSNLTIGNHACEGIAVVKVAGGALFVTNATASAVLDVRGGTLRLISGTLTVDKLVMTNFCARFVRGGGTLSVGSMILTWNFDADGDLLPNGWEQLYGLNPLDSVGNNGPFGDPDGDGYTNFDEYLADTDPTDPNSHPGEAGEFLITAITRQGNNVLLTWKTIAGKTNVVQATAGTLTGSYSNNFTDISGNIVVPGSGTVITNFTDTNGATNKPVRYYRVRLVP